MKVIFAACLMVLSACSSEARNGNTGELFCGNTQVHFVDTCWQQPLPGIQFLHVHENEKTAVQAIHEVLNNHNQGCFVTWHSQDDRYVSFELNGKHFKFDPNRIYSDAGLEASLKKNGDYNKKAFDAVDAVAKRFLDQYINHKKLLVAVHNNTEKEWDVQSTINAGETADSYVNPLLDPDDFILTTDRTIFEYMKTKQYNVVLQKEGIPDDGSLSVYAAVKKIPYINIEAQMGHLQEQKQMLEAVIQLIAGRYQ